MKNSVSVSIIMGVYNPRNPVRFLRAVHSIIGQSLTDWELLLCDDGSDAAHTAVIRRAARLDSRIRILRTEENRGLAYALNNGIRHAAGEFIARMDDDDLSEPDRLRIQAAFLRSHPHYQWVGSNAQLIDDYGVWGFQRMPERPQAKDFLFNSPFIHPAVMFRRQTLVCSGGYCTAEEVRQCEDYELFMRLYHRGFRGYNLQEPLLQYREDYAAHKKRTYRRRIREMKVRYHGFKALGLLDGATFAYVLKPLAVGAVPAPVHHYINQRLKRRE